MSVVVAIGLAAGRTLVTAGLLGAREMGVMGVALLALGTLDAFTATGVETSLVSRRGKPEADLDSAFTLQLSRAIVLAGVLCALALPTARFFATPQAAPVLWALAGVPLLRGIANPGVALLVRRAEFRRLFWWGLPEALVGFVVAVALAVTRRDVWALVAGALASQLTATIASYAAAPYRPRLKLRGRGMRRLLHHAKWMQGTRILMFASLRADDLAVGRFLGTEALGLYQVAFRIAEIPVLTFTRAAAQVALPLLAQTRRDPERLRRRHAGILASVVAVNSAFAALVLLLGGTVVEQVLGPAWRPIVPSLRILSGAMILRGVMIVVAQLFYAVGRPQPTLWANAVRLGVTLALLYPFIAAAGLAGAAAAVLVAHLISAAVALTQAWRLRRAPVS